MDSSSTARIRLSVAEGILEVEGSEEFVAKHIEALKELVSHPHPRVHIDSNQRHATAPAAPSSPMAAQAQGQIVAPGSNGNKIHDYQYLYAIDAEGRIHITKQLPGKNNREKVVNAALLYLYAHQLKGGEPEAFLKEISLVCGEHGCLDKANFAGHVKTGSPQLLTVSGGGQGAKLTARLTFTGGQEARKLADELNKA